MYFWVTSIAVTLVFLIISGAIDIGEDRSDTFMTSPSAQSLKVSVKELGYAALLLVWVFIWFNAKILEYVCQRFGPSVAWGTLIFLMVVPSIYAS